MIPAPDLGDYFGASINTPLLLEECFDISQTHGHKCARIHGAVFDLFILGACSLGKPSRYGDVREGQNGILDDRLHILAVPCQNSIHGRIGARRSTDNLGCRNGIVIWMSAYCCWSFRHLMLLSRHCLLSDSSGSIVMLMKTLTKRILSVTASNTSLKLSRFETNPACIAGVLISDPNFSAL
jgi:hypothetical protein